MSAGRTTTAFPLHGGWRKRNGGRSPSSPSSGPGTRRGTAGGRPGFSYQYQTYAVDRGRIIPKLLGNNSLKPELATEQEYGVDMMVADRYRVQLNYVDLEVRDQLLLVPLSSALGFESQWRNAGTVASTTWEASLEAAFVGASRTSSGRPG